MLRPWRRGRDRAECALERKGVTPCGGWVHFSAPGCPGPVSIALVLDGFVGTPRGVAIGISGVAAGEGGTPPSMLAIFAVRSDIGP
jgi:hypothetical protein